MKLKTDNKAHFIKIDPFETIVVEFSPDGVTALEHGKKTSFVIGTLLTPDGGMALSLSFPLGKTYKIEGEALKIVLCDFEGFEKLAFMTGDSIDSIVELDRI